MASSGITSWMKHFKSNTDITTVTKTATAVYDRDNPKKKLTTVNAGTKVIFLKSTEYEQRALVKVEVNGILSTCRIPIDNLVKPKSKSSGAISLKPQAFNITDTDYSISGYTEAVKSAIEKYKDLNDTTRTFISHLFDYCSTPLGQRGEIAKNLTKFFESQKKNLPIADINKDFGEVLGPVACYFDGLLRDGKGKILLSNEMEITIPKRPNEPLMDYKLKDGEKTYIISAKSGTSTNTVKPGDVLSLIDKNPKTLEKWKDSKQYKLLVILRDNSVLMGPIKGAAFLGKFGETLTPDNIQSMLEKHGIKIFETFISQNEYFEKKAKEDPITLNEIRHECEKIIKSESISGKIIMTQLFADAVRNEVIYVKLEIDKKTGIPKWTTIISEDIEDVESGLPAFLRSKYGHGKASDKMGIQI